MISRLSALSIVMLLFATGAAHAQSARTGRMMREKLVHAQQVLEALTTSNYEKLDRESAALSRIAGSSVWEELKTRELRIYTDNFLKAVADLSASAKRRDLDSAAVQYTTMVTACYQCHRHLKDARIAR
jgi:cytochrome c556